MSLTGVQTPDETPFRQSDCGQGYHLLWQILIGSNDQQTAQVQYVMVWQFDRPNRFSTTVRGLVTRRGNYTRLNVEVNKGLDFETDRAQSPLTLPYDSHKVHKAALFTTAREIDRDMIAMTST